MIDLAGHSFPDNRASFVCRHVWEGDPVLVFVYDSDRDIQFLCGASNHTGADALIIGLTEMRVQLLSMEDIPTIGPGHRAARAQVGGPWTIQAMRD